MAEENLETNELLEELKSLFQIETLGDEHHYWLIRAGIDSSFFEEFYTRKFTGINIPSSNDIEVLKNSTKEELKKFFEQQYPDEKNPGHLIGKLYNFINEIKKGDVIVMPSAKKEKIAFGIIEEENFYIDNSLILEESLNAADAYGIPNKRRKVKWVKLVNSTQLPSKLLLNLFSPHGLSAITDEESINIIDTNISDFFIKGSTTYMTFNIKTEEEIGLNDFANYFSTINDVVKFTNSYFKDKEEVSIKINLNSPGTAILAGPVVLLLGTAILLALIGCDFNIEGLGIKLKVQTKGILGYITSFLEHQREMKKMDLEYKKSLVNLQIVEPQKIKEVIEKLEKNIDDSFEEK